jgi:uncharacterized protein (TIGR02444 family)
MTSDNPFWDFSLALYRRPGVAEACLRLQDDAGVDVNLLLYFCWLATVRGTALDDSEIGKAVEGTDAWRARVVRPLREIRRSMKGGVEGMAPESAESLRSEVKRIELQSERLQQDLLFRMAGSGARAIGGPGARRRAEENIARYLKLIGVPPAALVERDCRVVVEAGTPI